MHKVSRPAGQRRQEGGQPPGKGMRRGGGSSQTQGQPWGLEGGSGSKLAGGMAGWADRRSSPHEDSRNSPQSWAAKPRPPQLQLLCMAGGMVPAGRCWQHWHAWESWVSAATLHPTHTHTHTTHHTTPTPPHTSGGCCVWWSHPTPLPAPAPGFTGPARLAGCARPPSRPADLPDEASRHSAPQAQCRQGRAGGEDRPQPAGRQGGWVGGRQCQGDESYVCSQHHTTPFRPPRLHTAAKTSRNRCPAATASTLPAATAFTLPALPVHPGMRQRGHCGGDSCSAPLATPIPPRPQPLPRPLTAQATPCNRM